MFITKYESFNYKKQNLNKKLIVLDDFLSSICYNIYIKNNYSYSA